MLRKKHNPGGGLRGNDYYGFKEVKVEEVSLFAKKLFISQAI
jgi:hypothetical protein